MQGPDVADLNRTSDVPRATSLYPVQRLSRVQYFKPLNLRRELQSLEAIYDSTYIDKHWEFNEQLDRVPQYEQVGNEHLVSKQYLLVDHLKYPRQANHFTVYP